MILNVFDGTFECQLSLFDMLLHLIGLDITKLDTNSHADLHSQCRAAQYQYGAALLSVCMMQLICIVINQGSMVSYHCAVWRAV